MTRTMIPLTVPDLSAFARHLQRQLTDAETPPGHLALMNMLARAGGWQNYQHLRASALAADRLAEPPPPAADYARVRKLLNQFDAQGNLMRWPSKTQAQHSCVWALWARLPAGQMMNEREISAALNGMHAFGDAAILRRTMVELGLVTRSTDGRIYRRVELAPPPDARALIAALQGRINSPPSAPQ